MSEELSLALVALKRDEVVELVKTRAASGEDPFAILGECRHGMNAVGERFQAGDYYLAELLLSAEIFKAAVAILDPYLVKAGPREALGTVVLATMRGDIHDLGKNIVATLLRAYGFDVHDLGVNVAPALLVEKVKQIRPDFVGLSVLLTTAFGSMKEAVELLVQAGIRNQLTLLIGGGVTTPAVKEYVGADFQTTDATEGVAYCVRTANDSAARGRRVHDSRRATVGGNSVWNIRPCAGRADAAPGAGGGAHWLVPGASRGRQPGRRRCDLPGVRRLRRMGQSVSGGVCADAVAGDVPLPDEGAHSRARTWPTTRRSSSTSRRSSGQRTTTRSPRSAMEEFYYEDYLWRITDLRPDELDGTFARLVRGVQSFASECARRGTRTFFGADSLHPFFALSLMRSMVPFTQDLYYNPDRSNAP